MEDLRATNSVPLTTRVQSAPKSQPTGQLRVDGPPDRLSRLPPAAAAKLSKFIAAQDNAFAIRQSVGDERNRVLRERGVVTQTLSRLDASREPEGSSLYLTAYAERDRLERELEALDNRLRPLDDFRVDLRAIERAIDAMDVITLSPVPLVPDDATVESVRAEIVRLTKQLAEARGSPLSANECHQRAREWIRARAATPTVNPMGDVIIPPLPPTRTKFADAFVAVPNAKGNFPRVDGFIVNSGDDVLGVLCALMPDVMLKQMTRDLPDGLPSEDRAARIEELNAAILEAERCDVLLSEAAGRPYRADTDVRALLGIA